MRIVSSISVALFLWASPVSAGSKLIEDLPTAYDHLTAIESVTDQGLCVEWAGTALSAGWPPQLLERLLFIVHRESRCRPDACSIPDRPDIRRCRDWGLTQINDYSWKRTVRNQGLEMDAMWNPYENLRFAWWLYNYSQESTGCGWTPWSLRCRSQD